MITLTTPTHFERMNPEIYGSLAKVPNRIAPTNWVFSQAMWVPAARELVEVKTVGECLGALGNMALRLATLNHTHFLTKKALVAEALRSDLTATFRYETSELGQTAVGRMRSAKAFGLNIGMPTVLHDNFPFAVIDTVTRNRGGDKILHHEVIRTANAAIPEYLHAATNVVIAGFCDVIDSYNPVYTIRERLALAGITTEGQPEQE